MLSVKSVKITPEILKNICQIDEFKGSWNALQTHTTALNLLSDVANFGQNFTELFTPLQNVPLNKTILTKLLLVVQRAKSAQDYKEKHMPLVIQNGDEIIGTLDTAAPEDVEGLMNALLGWVETTLEKEDIHPLIIIALFSAVFLQICPFEKGNQRLIRLLITLLMFRSGYIYAPYVSFEDLFAKHSHAYFKALGDIQESLENGRPDWEPWIIFFLDVLKDQKDVLQSRMTKSEKDLPNLPTLSTKIMKLFQKENRLQMKEIERLTRGRRSTLKLRLGELVDAGYLKRHGQARSTWYSKV